MHADCSSKGWLIKKHVQVKVSVYVSGEELSCMREKTAKRATAISVITHMFSRTYRSSCHINIVFSFVSTSIAPRVV